MESAPRVSFKKISARLSSDWQNLVFSIDFSALEMKDKRCSMKIYFYNEKTGKALKDYNSSYCTSSGQVCVAKSFTPSYSNSEYTSFKISIPMSELHLLEGTFYLYYNISAFCNGKKVGGSRNKSILVARYNSGTSFGELSADGSGKITNYWKCNSMYGCKNGTCPVCGGAGKFSTSFASVECTACNNGICRTCNGKGHVEKTTYERAWKGNSSGQSGNRSSGGSHYGGGYSGGSYSSSQSSRSGSSRSSSSSSRVCPGCNGTGKGRDEITYAPNYTGKDNSSYCSRCGKVMSAHSHRQPMCRTCYGKGRI